MSADFERQKTRNLNSQQKLDGVGKTERKINNIANRSESSNIFEYASEDAGGTFLPKLNAGFNELQSANESSLKLPPKLNRANRKTSIKRSSSLNKFSNSGLKLFTERVTPISRNTNRNIEKVISRTVSWSKEFTKPQQLNKELKLKPDPSQDQPHLQTIRPIVFPKTCGQTVNKFSTNSSIDTENSSLAWSVATGDIDIDSQDLENQDKDANSKRDGNIDIQEKIKLTSAPKRNNNSENKHVYEGSSPHRKSILGRKPAIRNSIKYNTVKNRFRAIDKLSRSTSYQSALKEPEFFKEFITLEGDELEGKVTFLNENRDIDLSGIADNNNNEKGTYPGRNQRYCSEKDINKLNGDRLKEHQTEGYQNQNCLSPSKLSQKLNPSEKDDSQATQPINLCLKNNVHVATNDDISENGKIQQNQNSYQITGNSIYRDQTKNLIGQRKRPSVIHEASKEDYNYQVIYDKEVLEKKNKKQLNTVVYDDTIEKLYKQPFFTDKSWLKPRVVDIGTSTNDFEYQDVNFAPIDVDLNIESENQVTQDAFIITSTNNLNHHLDHADFELSASTVSLDSVNIDLNTAPEKNTLSYLEDHAACFKERLEATNLNVLDSDLNSSITSLQFNPEILHFEKQSLDSEPGPRKTVHDRLSEFSSNIDQNSLGSLDEKFTDIVFGSTERMSQSRVNNNSRIELLKDDHERKKCSSNTHSFSIDNLSKSSELTNTKDSGYSYQRDSEIDTSHYTSYELLDDDGSGRILYSNKTGLQKKDPGTPDPFSSKGIIGRDRVREKKIRDRQTIIRPGEPISEESSMTSDSSPCIIRRQSFNRTLTKRKNSRSFKYQENENASGGHLSLESHISFSSSETDPSVDSDYEKGESTQLQTATIAVGPSITTLDKITANDKLKRSSSNTTSTVTRTSSSNKTSINLRECHFW